MGIVFENNEYALISESAFHTKLYKITGNKIISEFQEIIHPILVYVKEKFKDYLEIKQSQKKLLDVMTLELVGFQLQLEN